MSPALSGEEAAFGSVGRGRAAGASRLRCWGCSQEAALARGEARFPVQQQRRRRRQSGCSGGGEGVVAVILRLALVAMMMMVMMSEIDCCRMSCGTSSEKQVWTVRVNVLFFFSFPSLLFLSH